MMLCLKAESVVRTVIGGLQPLVRLYREVFVGLTKTSIVASDVTDK